MRSCGNPRIFRLLSYVSVEFRRTDDRVYREYWNRYPVHFVEPPYSPLVDCSTWNTRETSLRGSSLSCFFVVESALSPEFHKQDIHVGGRNPGDTRSLADRRRADAREFLPCLDRERLHRMIVEIGRDGDIFESMQLFGDEFFPLNISLSLIHI